MTAVTSVAPKRFTLDEYHRLGELGFFDADIHIELIRGEIIQMPSKKTPHSVCNTSLVQELILLLLGRAIVRGQEPVILLGHSEPQPDVAIVRHQTDRYLSAHPTPEDILLLIEVSDSTLKYDQKVKLPLYAEAGISDYWIFNLVQNFLELYSHPYQDLKGDFGYANRRICLSDQVVSLPHFSDLSIDLAKIFP